MITVCDSVRDIIEAAGYGPVYLRLMDGPASGEGVVVRRQPSTIVRRDYARSAQVSYIYQVIVRRRSERSAIEDSEALAGLLDHAAVPGGDGYEVSDQSVYTFPAKLQGDEQGYYEYGFRMRAELEIHVDKEA